MSGFVVPFLYSLFIDLGVIYLKPIIRKKRFLGLSCIKVKEYPDYKKYYFFKLFLCKTKKNTQEKLYDLINFQNEKIKHLEFQLKMIDDKVKEQNDYFLVSSSNLFDEKYYLHTYPDVKTQGLPALEHYLKIGWQLGYNPSKTFNSMKYLEIYKDVNINPLVHFIRFGKRYVFYGYFENCFLPKDDDVRKYLENEKNRVSKKIIYTCIVNNYDNLTQQKYINNDWDYICFTDNQTMLKQNQIGIWQIRPLPFNDLDDTRKNRYPKLNPHLIFPQYDESIYIDANINILTPFLFKTIENQNKNLLLPIHYRTICAYKEIDWALSAKIDNETLILAQRKMMEKSKFPKNFGMSENNIIYRKHNEKEIIEMMDDWWTLVKNYCKRDQPSLPFVFYKHNKELRDYTFSNARTDFENFCFIKHLKDRV